MSRHPTAEDASAKPARPADDQRGLVPDGLQRLWAPWRRGYVVGDAPVDGCPFCVLPARGAEHDADNLILYRGARAYAILNAYPYNPGHLMVVPFDHVADLEAIDTETSAEVWQLGVQAVTVLRTRLGCEGANLGANLGVAAGAGIADHVHLHVVPRWAADTNFMPAAGATRVLSVALAEVYDRLAPGFHSVV